MLWMWEFDVIVLIGLQEKKRFEKNSRQFGSWVYAGADFHCDNLCKICVQLLNRRPNKTFPCLNNSSLGQNNLVIENLSSAIEWKLKIWQKLGKFLSNRIKPKFQSLSSSSSEFVSFYAYEYEGQDIRWSVFYDICISLSHYSKICFLLSKRTKPTVTRQPKAQRFK